MFGLRAALRECGEVGGIVKPRRTGWDGYAKRPRPEGMGGAATLYPTCGAADSTRPERLHLGRSALDEHLATFGPPWDDEISPTRQTGDVREAKSTGSSEREGDSVDEAERLDVFVPSRRRVAPIATSATPYRR